MRRTLPKNTDLERGFFLTEEGKEKERKIVVHVDTCEEAKAYKGEDDRKTQIVWHFSSYEEAAKFQRGTRLVMTYYLKDIK